MADVWDQAEQDYKSQQKPVAPSPASGGASPAAGSGDVWAQAESDYHKNPAVQPAAGQTSDQHGLLYRLADKALNSSSVNDPGYQSVRPSGILGNVTDAVLNAGDAPTDLVRGIAKGALSSASGLGSIFNRFTGSKQSFNQDNLRGITTANGVAQGVGKGAEQVGEFAAMPGAGALSTAGKIGIEAAKSGILSAVQSGGDPVATAAGAIVPTVLSAPVFKAAGKLVSEGLGLSSGAGSAAIKRAFANPDSSDLVNAMKGNIGPDDIVSNVQDAVTRFRDNAAAKYSQDLDNTVKNAKISNWSGKASKFISDMRNKVDTRMQDFGVVKSTNANGGFDLNMRHVPTESGLKEGLQQVHDMVADWGSEPRDLTPSGLDTLKKNISPYIDQGGRLGAFAKSIYDSAKDGLNNIIPGYSAMTKDYADSSSILKEIKSALSVKADGNTNTHAAVSKIQYLLKQPTNYRELIINKLPEGQQILDQIAGLHLSSIAPRGLIGKLFLGGEGIGMMTHPASVPGIAVGALASSPRVVGESARVAGRVANAGPIISRIAKGTIPSAIANSRSGQD